MAATSSSSNFYASSLGKYDVFISFRGEDTRLNFTSHLYAAFCRKNIKAYIDEYSLEKGDQISPALLEAIQESKLSVIIFSKDYASSTWCLEELVHILKCNKERGQIVLPVFYGIDPSCIRKQKETYAAAFATHEKRFKDKMEKVKEWRDALTAVANISGFDSRDGSESKLVEKIVECALRNLNHISSTVGTDYHFKDLVGINKYVEEVENLLSIESKNDVCVIGIWGMGGIGKTTLARVIFNRLIYQFESGYFLANVKEESAKQGLISLQKKLFVELLEDDKGLETPFFRSRLSRRKVLVVIDDVDNADQVECLIGDHIQFGVGSKVLVTSRDRQVLKKRTDVIMYTLEGLDFDDALELFCLNAFKRNCSETSYIELSNRAVSYAKGNPLALKVLGSFLYSRSIEEWENALNKLEMIPHRDILKVLRISYDDGLDETEKDIFLDIACFFKGERVNFVESILDGCGFFPKIGIKVLIDKSLITVNDKNEIWMHDLVQEVGWEIVREQSTKDPGKRSRLWIAKDICHVLNNKRETETLEGIYLDMSKIDKKIRLKPTAFQKLWNLRLLKIYNSNYCRNNQCKVYLSRALKFLPNSLRYLSWYEYPSKSLPSKFEPRNLVELDMPYSELKELWNGVQHLENLKHIDIGFSNQLIKVPDLSKAPKLESINVESCPSLLEVPPLNFQIFYEHKCQGYCDHTDRRHLGSLTLDGCTNFRTLPEIRGNIKYLDLGRTAIEELPSSIESFENLITLQLFDCRSLKFLPNLPRNIEILQLSGLTIEEVPLSIGCLQNLRQIILYGCKRLKSLPASICKLKFLGTLILTDCSRLRNFSETLSLEWCQSPWINLTLKPRIGQTQNLSVALESLQKKSQTTFVEWPKKLPSLFSSFLKYQSNITISNSN